MCELVLCSIVAVTLFFGRPANGVAGWEYTGSLGPSEWHKNFPDCAGRMQSPININTRQVLYDPSMDFFDLRQYSTCEYCKMTLSNVDGHTAEVKYSGTPIIISGGTLPDEYVLDQFHFHWGSASDIGSEHTLDYKAAPMELHIVHHMNSINSTEAAKHPYGLAVLGFFFKIGNHNPNFDFLLSHFKNISHKDNEIELKPFSLKSLLPSEAKSYYRYFGSLTTPPCYETVIWTLFTDKIEISEDQLAIFRTLKTVRAGEAEEVSLVNDFRPLQKLHERSIYSNDLSTLDNLVPTLMAQLREEADRKAQQSCTSASPPGGTHAGSRRTLDVCVLLLIFLAVELLKM